LVDTDRSYRALGVIKADELLDTTALLFDVNRRGYFNKLISDMEGTFEESTRVKNCWTDLKSQYAQMGRYSYTLAGIIGVGGYGILLGNLSAAVTDPSTIMLIAATISAIAVIVVILMLRTRSKINTNLSVYEAAKKKYLVDITRVET
jgi:uncharacterized membrane protein YeaQ/YmgE (transglycosylase-associated protein family)